MLGAAEGSTCMSTAMHRRDDRGFLHSVIAPFAPFIIAALLLLGAAAGLIVSLATSSAAAVAVATAPSHPAGVRAELTSTSAVRSSPPGTHIVASGDTLSGISKHRYGVPVCWPGIYNANRAVVGGDPDLIYPGQRLTVPPVCGKALAEQPATQTAQVTSQQQPQVLAASTGGLMSRTGRTHGDHNRAAPVTGPYDPQNTVLSQQQIETLWVAAGGPQDQAYNAYVITQCESGGNRFAYNPSGATGIWQILGQVTLYGQPLTDAWVNAKNAVSKYFTALQYTGYGWSPWVCQP